MYRVFIFLVIRIEIVAASHTMKSRPSAMRGPSVQEKPNENELNEAAAPRKSNNKRQNVASIFIVVDLLTHSKFIQSAVDDVVD
jgi:hypothetical protein